MTDPLEDPVQLVEGPRDAADLVGAVGASGPFLHRLLRLLVTRGTFREDEDGKFHLTASADVLRADAIRHGEPAFDRRFGHPVFDHLIANPDAGARFNEGMGNFSTTTSGCRRATCSGRWARTTGGSPGDEPHLGKLLDMFMPTLLPGPERTEPEFRRLLDRAGLRVTRVVPATGTLGLIEADAAESV